MRPLIAVPVYNEAWYIERVLRAIRRVADDVLVIDDGSTDATPALLRRHPEVMTLTHLENRGYGQSLIDAFGFAAARGFDWVITIDCDEQHEPAQIPEFLRAAAKDDADVISGSRYRQPHPDDMDAPADRRRINFLISDVLEQTLGLRLTDSFCGFKAHRVAAMARLRLDEPGYAFPLQFWVQCVLHRLRIRELPVRRIYRETTREFGGTLDDPAARLQHYLSVFTRALACGNMIETPQTLTRCRCQPSD
jgi:glycosyltransferase involved in cell wall biosynthesis